MISYHVNDMTCGHCVATITKAVKAVDQGAQIQIDLATHRVDIEPAGADASRLGDAITQAGFSPVLIERQAGGG